MAENVGSVEIKLVLNRDDFDLQISTLAEQPPVSVLMRAGLDTKQLEADLKAIGARTIDVKLNTDAISRQLDDALTGRAVAVRLKLDATAFNDELRVLTNTNRQISIGVSLDDRFDDQALDLRIKTATRDRTVRVFGVAEFTSLNQSLAALDKHLSRSLTPTVDDRALTQLNEHLSLKQQHWAKVREDLSKPIKPTIDESDLESSLSVNRSPIIIPAVVVVDRTQIDALAGQTVTLRLAGNTTELKRDIDGITKARVAIGGTGTNNALSLNPFKFVGNIGANILGGALTGVGMELSKSLGGGITKAIEGAISGTFGSTNLLGEILGKKLTGAIGGGINKSSVILKSLEEYVDKVEPETPEGIKRKRQIKQVISQVQEAPQKVADSLTREVGAREVSREQFLRRGAVSDQRKAQDTVVSVQADTEYQDRARELAVSSARKAKLDTKANKQIESKSERLGTIASDIEPLQAEIKQFSESQLGKAVSDQSAARSALKEFKPRTYSKEEIRTAKGFKEVLPTEADQKQVLIDRVSTSGKAVKSLQFTSQSPSDKAFEQLDRESGKTVAAFVPIDLVKQQNERLTTFKKLLTEGKLIEKDVSQLKTAKQSAAQTVEKDEFKAKLSDSFRPAKPLGVRRIEASASMERLGNIDEVKARLGTSRTIAETSLKNESGKSLDIAKAKFRDTSGESSRAETRRSNVVQARRLQFQESVDNNEPLENVEALKAKLDRTESRAGRGPSLKVKATETKAALNTQLGKIAALKAEISTTDDAIAEITDLHFRTVAEFNAVEFQLNKGKGKAARKEIVREPKAVTTASDVAAIKAAQPIGKITTPITVPEPIKSAEKAPNLEALTRAQLYAVAKQQSIQGVTATTKKADLISQLSSNIKAEKLGPIVSNIDSTFDKQGKPVKGYDTAKESAVIAQIKQQERAINDRIAQVKKLSGIGRINALESLNIESSQFVTQLEKLKGTGLIAGFSGPTMKTIGSTQGRVSASISSKPETAESRDNRLKATSEAMRGPTYGRSFAELVDTAAVKQVGQAQTSQGIRLARVSRANLEPMPAPRRPFLDLSAKAAEFFGATPGASIRQNLGAATRTDKARGMMSEMAIMGAGMVASSAASGSGSIAGGAASIGATLVTRLAIESGAQYSAAIKRLKQQESFLKASLIQKAKMLAGAAKEINLNKTGDAITGDIAGFTIGTAGAAMKNGLAASLGMPMLAQLPLDAIAATILPGKVVSARQSFAVARAGEPKQDNIIDRLKTGVSNLRPINNERLQANYSAFQQTYSKNNSGSAIGSLAPRLEIADKELKASGASALYDVDRNVVMVSKALARALDQPVQSLAKVAQKLEPLTHEIQHSNQFAGGQLNVEQASMGLGTPLSSIVDPKNKSAIDKSVAIAASQNPGLNKGQLHKLEVDAYASESRTLGTLIEMQANAGIKTPPLNAIGLKVSSVMDKVRNSVGDGIDNFRETVLGQSNIANISRTTRAYGQVDRSLGRRADQSSALADAAYDEARKRSINSETAETSAANTAQAGRFSGVARRLGLVPEGEARAVSISSQPQSRVSRIASEFQDAKSFVTGGIASVTSDFAKGEAKKLAYTAIDARTLSADIGTSQAIATRDGNTDEAKSLGKLKRRVDVTADRAERVSSQDSFTGKDAKKISDLKSQFNEIYQTAGRPIPHPFEEMKGAAGGLIGNLRGVGLGLLALPFAAAGIGMAANAMKQFGSEAIQAAIASDRVKTALTFSTGSKSGGDRAYQYAADQASILGVDRNASIDGYSKLRASSKGKISEGQSNTLFEGVGAAATTLGLTAEDQSGVFRALGQVMSKGSVQAEQLRGEIGERLPGAFAIAARSVGMSEAQLSKAMEMGSISAEKFIPKFGAQLKQEFGPGAKDASQNLQSSMFRLSGATGKATEDTGAALAVPVKFGVDAAVSGLALLEQHGNTLMAVIGIGLANAAYTGMSAIVASLGGLKSMGIMALEAAGGVSGLGRSIMSTAATVGPMIGQFLLINASIEIGKALFSAFTPDDMGSRFEEQANKIQQSLDDIEKKGSDAKKSLSDVQGPSKGIDIEKATFGLSNAVGIKKGDDVVKNISKPDGSGIADNGFVRALSMGTPVGFITEIGRRVNESNGGKGLATMAEVQFNKSKISLADQGDKIYGATGKTFDSLPELRKKAAESQSEQKTIDQKQVEKAKELSTGAPDKNKVLKLDEDIKAAGERRDKNNVGFVDQRSLIGSQIIDLKSQREGLKDNKDYTPGQKTELESQINAQLGQLEGAKKQLDAIDKKFGGSVDIMGKFNVSLSEMAAKIEATAAVAKNAFNSSEVKRLEGRNANRGKDEFATQNSAVKQAENEKTRASSEFTGTKKTIDEINKVMEDPTVKTEISKIAINGQSVTGETSASDLEQAKAGRPDGEKNQIEKLIARRKAIDSLPELKKNELESDEKVFSTKSALALEKNDRTSKVREFENKGFEGKANVELINAQKGNKVNERDVPVRQAEIGKIAANLQVASIGESIKGLDALFAAGTISKEEYTKRSMDLRSSLVDATTKAAQAELAVEQAKNKRIIDDFELTIKKREVGRKEKTGADTVGLINAQKGNKINESDVAIKRAEISSTSAKGELSETKQEMTEVDALKAKGVITEQEYTKRKIDLRSRLVDATIKAAEAELAIEQAKNKKILADWERNVKARELATKRLDAAASIDLAKGQARNQMTDDEVAVKKAENQGNSANASANNIQSQLGELDGLRAQGVITDEEYARRKMDLESQLLDAKVKSADAELAIEQAKNRKIVDDYDIAQKKKIFILGIKDKTDNITANFNQLNGTIQGEGGGSEARKREIASTKKRIDIADKAIDKDVDLRNDGTISQKEFTDRSQNNSNTLRSEEEKLVNLLIQDRQSLYQKEHDALTRNTNVLLRGLELTKTRAGLASQLDGAKQGYAESAVGLGKAKAENAVAKIEANESPSNARDAMVANIRLQSLEAIQKAEMLILDLKEKQQASSLRQAAIEAQISFGKQKIAVSESQRKLKDALITGDTNQIANAQDDVAGQQQILGLEGEKIRSIETQNQLSTAKIGIDRQAAKLGMDTELTRARGAVRQAGGFAGGTQIQQNRVIGGGNFGGGIDLSALNAVGSQNNIKPINLGPVAAMPIFDPLAKQIGSPTAGIDRTVAQNAVPMALDDRNIVAAINRLGDRLDRLAPQKAGDNRRMPGYSDQLEAQTANTYART